MRLREVLEIIPSDLPLQLDIKACADIELARRPAEACCRTSAEIGRASQIEVISFFTPACEAAVAHGARARLVLWADYDPQALVKWVLDRGIDGLSLEGFILNQEFRELARGGGAEHLGRSGEHCRAAGSAAAAGAGDHRERHAPHDPGDGRYLLRRRSRSGGSCQRTALTTSVEILRQSGSGNRVWVGSTESIAQEEGRWRLRSRSRPRDRI
jgi:hypothetical protein